MPLPACQFLAAESEAFPMPPSLFAGDDALFVERAARARVYGEYGCGASTIWVATNSSALIQSVDTSAERIDHVRRSTVDAARPPRLTHVDLGPLGKWGRPLDYAARQRIPSYLEAPWQGEPPDLVLIDGRFRVACFLHSLLVAAPGTGLLFDDYANRAHYHLVEEFCPPLERCGRQALFEVPASLPRERITAERDRFLYVMD